MIRRHAEFLRTPKQRGGATLLHAVRSSRTETVIAVAAVAAAIVMVVRSPGFATFFLGGLLLFEGAVYASAPAASIAAEGIHLTPERREWLESPQNTGDRPTRRNTVLFGGAVALAVGAVGAIAAALIAGSPPDNAPFSAGNPPPIANPTATPGATSTPTASATPSPSPTATPTPSPRATPSPTSSPQASPSPAATPVPT